MTRRFCGVLGRLRWAPRSSARSTVRACTVTRLRPAAAQLPPGPLSPPPLQFPPRAVFAKSRGDALEKLAAPTMAMTFSAVVNSRMRACVACTRRFARSRVTSSCVVAAGRAAAHILSGDCHSVPPPPPKSQRQRTIFTRSHIPWTLHVHVGRHARTRARAHPDGETHASTHMPLSGAGSRFRLHCNTHLRNRFGAHASLADYKRRVVWLARGLGPWAVINLQVDIKRKRAEHPLACQERLPALHS